MQKKKSPRAKAIFSSIGRAFGIDGPKDEAIITSKVNEYKKLLFRGRIKEVEKRIRECPEDLQILKDLLSNKDYCQYTLSALSQLTQNKVDISDTIPELEALFLSTEEKVSFYAAMALANHYLITLETEKLDLLFKHWKDQVASGTFEALSQAALNGNEFSISYLTVKIAICEKSEECTAALEVVANFGPPEAQAYLADTIAGYSEAVDVLNMESVKGFAKIKEVLKHKTL